MTDILYELSIEINTEDFNKCFIKRNCKSLTKISPDEYADYSYIDQGLLFIFRNSKYKKKVKVIASLYGMGNQNDINSEQFIHKLKKKICKYFDDEYHLNDFVCSAVSLIRDTDLESDKNVASYINVVRRIGKVKKYHSISCIDNLPKNSFCLSGNSNGILLLLYAPDDISSADSCGVLRTEIRLNKNFIKNTTEHICTSKQIEDIIIQSNSLFKKIYFSIVPPGNYYKKRKAIDIINHEIDDVRLRRKMIKLVTLVSEKKSLLLAQKTMNTRGMCKIMNAFKIIGLSPITISKREKAQYLKNIY